MRSVRDCAAITAAIQLTQMSYQFECCFPSIKSHAVPQKASTFFFPYLLIDECLNLCRMLDVQHVTEREKPVLYMVRDVLPSLIAKSTQSPISSRY